MTILIVVAIAAASAYVGKLYGARAIPAIEKEIKALDASASADAQKLATKIKSLL